MINKRRFSFIFLFASFSRPFNKIYVRKILFSYHKLCHKCSLWLSLSQRKFTSAPTVLVSAEHERRGVKHDASSVWVEDVTTTSFKICVRELQNFDGAHESIHIVSCFVYLLCALLTTGVRTLCSFDGPVVQLRFIQHFSAKNAQV